MQLARLLVRILDAVFPPPDTARSVAETSKETFLSLAAPRALPSGITSLLPYRHPVVRAVIIEAKFRKNQRAFHLLGTVLATHLATRNDSYVLVPIPLSRERLCERGYNQVEEVIRASGMLPTDPMLKRVRHTKPQTSLARKERLQNMDKAFTIVRPVDPGTTYIVVDDVTTTGTTLTTAHASLSESGAIQIELLALAH